LIEPGHFENRSHVIIDSSQRELAAIFFDVLHCVDQDSQPRAVDECNSGKVDYEVLGTLGNHRSERALDAWRNMKIDFALERENIY
jgi:hypothetical protein